MLIVFSWKLIILAYLFVTVYFVLIFVHLELLEIFVYNKYH